MTCSVPGSRFNDSHWGNAAGANGQRAGHGRPVGPGLAASAKQADMVCTLLALPALKPAGALVASVMPAASFSKRADVFCSAAARVVQLCHLHILPEVGLPAHQATLAASAISYVR